MEVKGYRITPTSIINLFFGVLEKISSKRYLNLFKTIYINLRLLPFSQAIKLPIFVFGSIKVVSLIGSAQIRGEVKTGMIRLGDSSPEEFVGQFKSLLANQGTIIFNGTFNAFNGIHIRVSKGKTLEIGDNVMLSSNVSIYALDDIKIGNQTRIAYHSVIMSSDMHYSIDINSKEAYRNSAPIVIGNNNWITSNVKVMKGTVTSDWTIVTSGSFLNKNYSKSIPPRSIIGGSPAKLIKEGQMRVFSLESEAIISNFFAESDNKTFTLDANVDVDVFCKR